MDETKLREMAEQYVGPQHGPQQGPQHQPGPPGFGPPGLGPAEPPAYLRDDFQLEDDVQSVAGAARVTSAAVLGGLGCFLPWYTVRVPGISISAAGMQTDHGPFCLYALIAALVLTWVEKLVPNGKTAVLAAATLAAVVAVFVCFLEWNAESGALREFIGLTTWFYISAAAMGATAWFAFQRFQESRL